MDDRRLFDALCADPQSMLCVRNALCCNDLLSLIRERVYAPLLWGVNIEERRLISYSMASHALSGGAAMGLRALCKLYSVENRGWLAVESVLARPSLYFIQPSKPPVNIACACVMEWSTRMTLIDEYLLSISRDLDEIVVTVENSGLAQPLIDRQQARTSRFRTGFNQQPMLIGPCDSSALLVWEQHSVLVSVLFDMQSNQVVHNVCLPPPVLAVGTRLLASRPRNSQSVELWNTDGFAALYDARQNDWNVFNAFTSLDDILESAESIDDNLVVCSVSSSSVKYELKFYDRRAMAFVATKADLSTEKDFLRVVCV